MTLKTVAEETLQIIKTGKYQTANDTWVNFSQAQTNAENGTKHYTAEDFEHIANTTTASSNKSASIEVTNETTQVCLPTGDRRRL